LSGGATPNRFHLASSSDKRAMPTYTYRAVLIQQTETGRSVALFGASALEVNRWGGIPQKRELEGGEETVGFQRTVNTGRLESLKRFYTNQENTIQNALLCATRDVGGSSVGFVPDEGADDRAALDDRIQSGTLTINVEPLEELTLLQLMTRLKAYLEERVPTLAQREIPQDRIREVKQSPDLADYLEHGDGGVDDPAEDVRQEAADGPENVSEEGDPAEVLMAEETHILEFWDEVAARVRVLEELGREYTSDDLAGFTRDAMIAYLRPVVIVDGQHRLAGAVESVQEISRQEPYLTEAEQAVFAGEPPQQVQERIQQRISRRLPISLLIGSDPEEHVFQFIVVNQKATPIGKALLGTIVSTSLSTDELARVSDRLMASGIPLVEARSVAYLTRDTGSPFHNLVEKGLSSDASKDLLQWSVLVSLVNIFRNLQGGRLYHEKRIDYADKWKHDFLAKSGIVNDWAERGYDSDFAYWSDPAGPWRRVFIAFYSSVRDRLADARNPDTHNFWGSPRTSNLFNKIFLTILAADFFQVLCERKRTIDTIEDVDNHVTDWLEGVSPAFFNRDWKLEGVKKDNPGIRKQWSQLWVEYRKDPRVLPRATAYRQAAP
jgi:hypothetical protein